MRILISLIYLVVTVALILFLGTRVVTPIPLGAFLSPQHGMWQNAESIDHDYNADLSFPDLKEEATVYFDDRMVPHIFAQNDEDAFFIQGYLHAQFRLWQMEFQNHAAAGRLSEIVGNKPEALAFDRNQRRLGMVSAAETALEEIRKDPETAKAVSSYTKGVNAYINTLNNRKIPIEYKLLGYRPEQWTELKCALFIKFITQALGAFENDFEMTNAKRIFSLSEIEKIYPVIMDSLSPIVPKGTKFDAPPLPLNIPDSADSLYFNAPDTNNIEEFLPNKDNGSNNWAVSGRLTASGAPILANDPHLDLNLPSLLIEMQITTPGYSAYGVSFPGGPHIIFGFNNEIAWGFTTHARDVRDYYKIKFKDKSRKQYWYNNDWQDTKFRIEAIKIKDAPTFYDTIAITNWGPVMYDESFNGKRGTGNENYAVRWMGNEKSNELKFFYHINRAKNYDEYLEAISHLHAPGHNIIFASKKGDIAIWAQGKFPAKWRRQGDFVMPGENSDYDWQYMIPQDQNPHLFNPKRGYVSSANQLPTDTAYPYYLGGIFPNYRAFEIDKKLEKMHDITIQDMMKMQCDVFDVFGAMAVPELISRIDTNKLNANGKKYFHYLQSWDYFNEKDSKGATIFTTTWAKLDSLVWNRIFSKTELKLPSPRQSTLIDIIKRGDSSLNILAHLDEDVREAFAASIDYFDSLEKEDRLAWGRAKDTEVKHLLGLAPFSVRHLDIGGGINSINAVNKQHGPAWRMIVSLTDEIEAYGILAGGQSGHPGSPYYDNSVDDWVNGKYYKLWLMKESESNSDRIKYVMKVSKQK